MPNLQQPEMRRSGRDPLVQDSVEQRAQSAPANRGGGAPVPEAQRSTHGPRRPKDRSEGTEPVARSAKARRALSGDGGAAVAGTQATDAA
jgi:hypothetical protein